MAKFNIKNKKICVSISSEDLPKQKPSPKYSDSKAEIEARRKVFSGEDFKLEY